MSSPLRSWLYVSPWRDRYDASRLFLDDLIWQLKVKGDHVAMAPQPKVLLVAASEDEPSLVKMAEIAANELKGNRPLTGIAARLHGDTWETHVPQLGCVAWQQFRGLYRIRACSSREPRIITLPATFVDRI